MNPYLLAAILGVILVVAIVTRPKRDDDEQPAPKREVPDEGPARSVLDDGDDDEPARSVLDDGDDDEAGGAVPITAEGLAFLPVGREVRLLPLMRGDEAPESVPDWIRTSIETSGAPLAVLDRLYHEGAGGGVAGATHRLSAGDFTAARIKPGVAGSYAYRLETLGRDGDFGFFPFTTRQGAEEALHLLARHGILVRRLDEDGESIPASDEDFEEARRLYEESEQSLALDFDDDTPSGPAYSDRR